MALTSDLRPSTAVVPDAYGNPMSAPPAAVELYDQLVDRLARFHPQVVGLADRLVTEHPDVPMAQVAMAYLCLMSTDVADLRPAREAIDAASNLAVTRREHAHVQAATAWARGDWSRAATRLDDLLIEWPTDLLALLIGHQLDFFVGDRANLRDRVGRSLAAFDGHHHQPFVKGMFAFGLEECGTYDAAHRFGMEALDVHPDDVWAVHAVAHVHEMRGDIDEGVRFMAERKADWGQGNLFTVHLWWHHALYLLEHGRIDEVLATYDADVHHDGSGPVALELVDASSLLWRLRLEGVDCGRRFDDLADAWTARPGSGEPWYVFNDVHEVMALAGAGRLEEARHRIEVMSASVVDGAGASNRVVTAEVGVPIARALVATVEGRHGDAVDDLRATRSVLHHFGGSHAQRDVFQLTLVDAALDGGRLDLVDALLRERLAVRPTSVFGTSRQARVAAARRR